MYDYEDQFWGQGGSYTVDKNGQRVRVEETRDHPEGNRPRETEPVAPAADVTTTPTAEV